MLSVAVQSRRILLFGILMRPSILFSLDVSLCHFPSIGLEEAEISIFFNLYAPNIVLIMLMHGFWSARSGLRIRSFGRGGNLGFGWAAAAREMFPGVFFPATMVCDAILLQWKRLLAKRRDGSNGGSGVGSQRE